MKKLLVLAAPMRPYPAFTRAAEESIVHTRFDPAQLNGHPTAERLTQRFAFNLSSQ